MPILYLNFYDLPFAQQLPLVWAEGTFIGRRWQAGQVVVLYLLAGGFFCEVYLARGTSWVQQVQPFVTTDTARLEPYTGFIGLNDLLDA